MKINLGGKVYMDLLKLVVSRLLVQANSGGGKSWAIRRIIELAFKHIQIIVIDPEGEFSNLRSKFDFVYAGKGGDAPVESRSAGLLAHRLLELKASAIIDLYELPPQERKRYVRLFCESLVNAPKELWQDVLVIIDEAHVFAPEKGESEALGAVIDLCSRGRKRGFCAILATQRPAKLSKDAAAECNNKLIGRASLDIDRKRAAEELGFTTKEQVLSLRDLEPGEFYVFGPAISRDVEKVTIGDVIVKPAKRGVSRQTIPAPSEHVKKVLARLADIPAEAEKEIETSKTLKTENTTLKRKIQAMESQPQQVLPPMQMVEKAIKFALSKRADEELSWEKRMLAENNRLRNTLKSLSLAVRDSFDKLSVTLQKALDIEAPILEEREAKDLSTYIDPKLARNTSPTPPRPIGMVLPMRPLNAATQSVPSNSSDLTGPEQRILDAIALSESIGITEPEQTAVAFLAGYTYGGGGFNNPRGALKTKGFVEYRGKKLALTEEGRANANVPEAPLTGMMLRDRVMSILPGPEKKLLQPLIDAHPNAMSNEELQVASGYEPGGGFNNPKGRLRTLGLIEYPSPGHARAKDFLFP